MATPQQIAERLNDWTGQNITEEEAIDLIWALAVDRDLKADVNKAVVQTRNNLATERSICS